MSSHTPSKVFFHPDISEFLVLSEDESQHAIKVLRLKTGDEIFLLDGKGGFFSGVIVDANPKKCAVKILHNSIPGIQNFYLTKVKAITPRPEIHIAIAPTKNNNRFEWFLEKATELGVNFITPLICDHSERRSLIAPEREKNKNSRLEKILVSSMKQSLNLILPKLYQDENFIKFVSNANCEQKFIAHNSNEHLKNSYQKGKNALVLIGPEGDFSEKEIALAKEKGFMEVSLGNSRLRTETAGIVACQIIRMSNED